MAQGCTGNTPEPISCCPLNSFGNAADPNPATENCLAGYEPGSFFENSSVSPSRWFIMTACPDTWQCISGCEDEKYFLSVLKNDGAGLRQSIAPLTYTTIDFTSTEFEFPSGVGAWDGTNTLTVPYSGLYDIQYHVVFNLKGLTVNPLTDILGAGIVNGLTATPLFEMGGPQIYNSTGNEFFHLIGSKTIQLVAGETFNLRVIQDSGVNIFTVNSTDQTPAFAPPKAGFLTISQLS